MFPKRVLLYNASISTNDSTVEENLCIVFAICIITYSLYRYKELRKLLVLTTSL